MLTIIDKFLNNITMYRLVLYGLICLLVFAVFLAFIGILPFSGFILIFSTGFILEVSLLTNLVFAESFKVDANTESVYISALILALICSPPKNMTDLLFLFWASVLTISSKFIFAIWKKHIFNPVALSIFLTATFIGKSATWWVGNISMLIPVAVLGFLVIRKIRRFDLFLGFVVGSLYLVIIHGTKFITGTPILFFTTIMLTEPLTTPPTKKLRFIYGFITGIFYFYTPELALLLGNIYSYFVSPKERLILQLKDKIKIGKDLYDFVFDKVNSFKYNSGQYLEWNLGHTNPDSRGMRRYFTLSSSPTEPTLRIGVKFEENGSSYKSAMLNMQKGQIISAASLSGDFTLSKDKSKKLVFISGGIGITPFRSMIKYLINMGEKRDITLFYSDREISQIVYTDVFNEARSAIGLKAYYTLTELDNIPSDWKGLRGRLSGEMIMQYVQDYKNALYYLSGPHGLVEGFSETLKQIGVSNKNIIKDYFPGF